MSKINIIAFTRYDLQGASTRIRFNTYIPTFEKKKMSVLFSPLIDEKMLKNKYEGKKYNFLNLLSTYINRFKKLIKSKDEIYWIEKELFPWLPFWIENIFLNNKKYVLEFDDAIFHTYDENEIYLLKYFFKNKITKLAKRASYCVVGNEYLYNYCVSAGCKKVVIIPTIVDLKHYLLNEKSENIHTKIVWIGTPETVKYLDVVFEPLVKFHKVVNFELLLIGVASSIFDNTNIKIEYIPWESKTEVKSILKGTIGIMPLVHSNWEQGKCGYKLIQYMACGLPVIGSGVGINKQIIEHGTNGYIANSNEDWYTALNELHINQERRNLMGINGRKKIEDLYSLNQYDLNYCKIFEELSLK